MLHVLREVFYGLRRFGDIQARLGVSRSVLADRLDRMVADGLLARRPYRETGQRERTAYVRTEKGLALYPVIVAPRQRGDEHLAGAQGPPVHVEHAGCGAPVRAELRCAAGHPVGPGDVVRLPGSAAPAGCGPRRAGARGARG